VPYTGTDPGNAGGARPVINGGLNITVNGDVIADNATAVATEITSNIRSGRTTFSRSQSCASRSMAAVRSAEEWYQEHNQKDHVLNVHPRLSMGNH